MQNVGRTLLAEDTTLNPHWNTTGTTYVISPPPRVPGSPTLWSSSAIIVPYHNTSSRTNSKRNSLTWWIFFRQRKTPMNFLHQQAWTNSTNSLANYYWREATRAGTKGTSKTRTNKHKKDRAAAPPPCNCVLSLAKIWITLKSCG